ncbi:MAG: hypothetical protein ABIB43_06045 [archaeon]
MKKFLIFLTVFLLALAVVSAAPTFSISDVALGGVSQEREEYTTATLTVTNTGNVSLTGITFSDTADDIYEVTYTPTTVNVPINGTATVTVRAYVPDDFDAGIGTLGVITANDGTTSPTSALTLEAENNLIIKNMDISVNGESDSVDDGDSIDVFPASEIEIVIEMKNTHGSIDIEDIEVTIYNDDLDIDEDDSISKIKDGDRDTVTFSFSIDVDADEDDYDVEIKVEGEDENGAMHGETWVIEFQLDAKGIIITSAQLMPETLVCGAESVDLKVELTNVGTKDEDDAAIEIVAPSLNFQKRVSYLEIGEDDEILRTYQITVPEGTTPGIHVIELTAFMDFDEQTHSKFVYLNVPSGCNVVVDEEEEEEIAEPPIVIIPIEDEEVVGEEFVDSGELVDNEWDADFWMTTLLILGNILILVVIVILVVRFLVRG